MAAKISVLELYKNLVLVFSSPPVFTLSWGKIITIIYLAWCQLRVWTLEHLKRQGIKARNFLPSYYHVCSFKKHKACVVWLMHCDEHFGQEGDKLGVSSTKSVVDILPQRTSSRGEYFFVLLINGMVFFFTRYWSYFSLFTNGGCCNWFSRLLKISLCKKIDQKILCSFCVPFFPQILLLLLHPHSCDAGDHR